MHFQKPGRQPALAGLFQRNPMQFLDIRTILLMTFVTVSLCTVLMGMLWLQNRQRFAGLGFWTADEALNAVAFLLIALRGFVPDWLSIVVANTLAIGGLLCIFVGLERFFDVRGPHIPHPALLGLFALLYSAFTYLWPSLLARNLCLAATMLVIAVQSVWLLNRSLPPALRPVGRRVSHLMSVVIVLSAARLALALQGTSTTNDYMHAGVFSAAVVVIFQILRFLLVYAVTLMVNMRLISTLETEKDKFAKAFQSAPYAMILTALPGGEIIETNEMFGTLSGFSPAEALQKTTVDLGLWADNSERNAVLLALQTGHRVKAMKFAFRHKSGTTGTGLISIELLPVNGVMCALSSIDDITERMRTESDLEEYRVHLEEMVDERTFALSIAKEAAESASRAKSAFLATMSHELRTPLNAIMGMTDLALRRATDPRQKDHLAASAKASRHLLSVITDILDISQIEADRLTLDRTPFRLRTVTDTLRDLLEAQASAKGLVFSIDLPAPLADEALEGDPLRLGQVLLNLAGNAIKFTAQGAVRVSLRATGTTPEAVAVRCEIADTGPGIAAADLPRLFSPFEQLDPSPTRRHGGSGLGLAISKRLVKLMGGDIGVESTPGTGSVFWFSVQLAKAPAQMPTPTPAPNAAGTAEAELAARFAGAQVLVAEDEPLNQMVARGLLEAVGLRVTIASDGVQAVDLAAKTAYDLILMDMQMPHRDGLEAAQAIRALPECSTVPIVAMTANAYDDDRDRCLAAGMNDHLAKPIYPEVLYATLLRWLSEPRATDSA